MVAVTVVEVAALSIRLKWSEKMTKLLVTCLVPLIICSCTDRMAGLPEYWEYSPGKWVSFKETIELKWSYDNSEDVSFQISRVNVKLTSSDIKEIKKLIIKTNIDGLLAKENSLRRKINFNELLENYKSVQGLNFKDRREPIPAFDEMIIYNVKAVKNNKISLPAVLSVLFIDKSG